MDEHHLDVMVARTDACIQSHAFFVILRYIAPAPVLGLFDAVPVYGQFADGYAVVACNRDLGVGRV